jgi:hypothetical protein
MGYENPVNTQRNDIGFSAMLRKNFLKPHLILCSSQNFVIGYCEAAGDQFTGRIITFTGNVYFAYFFSSNELNNWLHISYNILQYFFFK